jgi:hypothetical protein
VKKRDTVEKKVTKYATDRSFCMATLAECERNFMASNAASAGIRIATLVITARLYSYVPKA